MPRVKQPRQESCRRSDRIREKVQKESTNIEKQESSSPSNNCTESQNKPPANIYEKRKAPAPQHSERQPKKPCRQQNSAVIDPVTTDQEWARAFIQTVKGSSIHYWVQNNQWPKKLFNSVLGYVLFSPPDSSVGTEEYQDKNEGENEKSNENRIEAYLGDKSCVLP